jgi:hypothetical protein
VQEKEEEGKFKQIPAYFASEVLSGSKLFYSELEKIAYAVVMAAVGNSPRGPLKQRGDPRLNPGIEAR